MRKHVVGLLVLALLVLSVPAFAQNPLVGTWEQISFTSDGKDASPTSLPSGIQPGIAHQMFSTDGFYMELRISKGRPQLTTPQDQWTKEDWQRRFQGTSAQIGTYSVLGDRLTMRLISVMAPQNEGHEVVWTFHKDGEDLVLTATGPSGTKIEQRWRRAK